MFHPPAFEVGLQPPSPTETLASPEPLEPPRDASSFYFDTVGSTFPACEDSKHRVEFSVSQLQTLFKLCKKILAKEILSNMDTLAQSLQQVCLPPYYPYLLSSQVEFPISDPASAGHHRVPFSILILQRDSHSGSDLPAA